MSRTLRSLAAAAALSASLVAHAGPDGERAYRRATAVALAGGIASVAGAPMAMGGLTLAIAGPEYSAPGHYEAGMALYVGGFAAVGSGGALLAGGSLAARRVLVRHGARVTPVFGSLTWVTWGATVATAFVLPMLGADLPGKEWIALTSYVATLGLGATQLALNHKAFRGLPEGALSRPRVVFGVTPTITPQSVGLSIAASF